MTELKINELNKFMTRLLKSEDFDEFMLKEGLVRTCIDYSFDGELHADWYDTAELETMSSQKYISWSGVKANVFELIKGKHTPLLMNIKLIANDRVAEELLRLTESRQEEKVLLNMNISFRSGELFIITGVYRSGFTLSKDLDNAWDSYVRELLKKQNIYFEVL